MAFHKLPQRVRVGLTTLSQLERGDGRGAERSTFGERWLVGAEGCAKATSYLPEEVLPARAQFSLTDCSAHR